MSTSFEYSRKKTIITVVMALIMFGLSGWQIERKAWKEGLLATIKERQQMEPIKRIPPNLSREEYIALDYRRAELTGIVDGSKLVYLGPRIFNNIYGYHQLTPMFLQDNKVILLNEGFVPADWVNGRHFVSQGVWTVSGTLRLPALPGMFTPNNPPEGNRYYWVDLMTIGNSLGTPRLLPVIFEMDRIGDQYPLGGQTLLTLPNDHLKYALFWAAMGLGIIIVYLMSSTRQHNDLAKQFSFEDLADHHNSKSGKQHGRNPDDPDQPPSLW